MSLEAITNAIKEKTAELGGFGSSIKFDFGDEKLMLDGTGDNIEVSNDDAEAACTIAITMEDFNALLSGELDAMSAFMSGKIKVDGDMMQAMKLQEFLG